MKNNHILFFLLLCLPNIINVYNSTLKKKTNHSTTKNKANNRFPKRRNEKTISKRKLQDVEGGSVEKYKPLKILIDTGELFASCPPGLEEYKSIIVEAMNKAKAILEDFLEIDVDSSVQFDMISGDINIFKDEYGILLILLSLMKISI